MSRHNRDRRCKYRCPCGNRFDTGHVERAEAAFTVARRKGAKIPERVPHSCGTCKKLSCLDGGKFRYLTPAEELAWRVDFEKHAAAQDIAMKHNLPDCMLVVPKN